MVVVLVVSPISGLLFVESPGPAATVATGLSLLVLCALLAAFARSRTAAASTLPPATDVSIAVVDVRHPFGFDPNLSGVPIKVTWKPPANASQVSFYVVAVQPTSPTAPASSASAVATCGSVTSYSILSLNPYFRYKVWVASSNGSSAAQRVYAPQQLAPTDSAKPVPTTTTATTTTTTT